MWNKFKRFLRKMQLETAMFVAGVEPIFHSKSRKNTGSQPYMGEEIELHGGDSSTSTHTRIAITHEINTLREINQLDIEDLTIFLGCRDKSEVEKILMGSKDFSEQVYKDKLERLNFYIRIYDYVKGDELLRLLNHDDSKSIGE